jgi:DNA-binding transcriptional ArsR family regulator
MKKVDLILHPIRLQILSTLSGRNLATQEIAEILHNIPVSTLYRQMRVLLNANLIQVVETHLIKGAQEKVFSLSTSLHLNQTEMQSSSKDQHMDYFLNFILSTLDGFSRYINQPGEREIAADYVGYTEQYFHVNKQELIEFGNSLNKLLLPLTQNEPGEGRHYHKIAFITHPEAEPGFSSIP